MVPPQSHSLHTTCCCLSFPTRKAAEMMPWVRVLIFIPLQRREGSGGGLLGPAGPRHTHPHPCCGHPLSRIPPLPTARTLGRSDPFSSPLQAPPPSPRCCHSQVRLFSQGRFSLGSFAVEKRIFWLKMGFGEFQKRSILVQNKRQQQKAKLLLQKENRDSLLSLFCLLS